MHHKTKESAVTKYKSLFENGASADDLKAAIAGDEKNYTADEVNEIAAAIMKVPPPPAAGSQSGSGEGEKKKPVTPAKKEKSDGKKVSYEEWRMERTANGLEKLKRIRGNVKISAEEADILNAGAESPGSVNPIMYHLPE